jgi:hypothetical protein
VLLDGLLLAAGGTLPFADEILWCEGHWEVPL